MKPAGVELTGAHIEGYLVCAGGRFDNPGGEAIDADGVFVGSAVFLSNGFHATSEVRFVRAHIIGQMICDGGNFENGGGYAINAEALIVDADIYLGETKGCISNGEISFSGAMIGGSLCCHSCRFSNSDKTALKLDAARISAGLCLTNVSSLDGNLDLRQADVRTLHDDGSAWPKSGDIILDGFTHQRFSGPLTGGKTRLTG